MATGGSIESISVDSRGFAVAADCDVKLQLGGYKKTAHRNGNGTTRYTGEQVPWSLTDIDVAVELDNDDLAFLQRTANNFNTVPCTITLVDGATYQGEGTVTGDVEFSTAKATAKLSLTGTGELTVQVTSFL